MSEEREIEAALAANAAFYRALGQGDYPAMDALWSASEPVLCSHPGTSALHGRSAVMESWRTILAQPPAIEVRDPRVVVVRGLAFVTCLEQIGELVLTATNALVWEEEGWQMILHQSGHLAPTQAKPSTPNEPLH